MTEINLKPYGRKFIVAPDDAWVFKMSFREVLNNIPVAVDIRTFTIEATLYHFYDEKWNKFLQFERKKNQIDRVNPENGIYFDSTDPSFSSAIFAFDWISTQPQNSLNLQNGKYRLTFRYNSPIGYKKTFLMYDVETNNDLRQDELPNQYNQEWVLIEPVSNVTINIQNTRI